MIGELGRYDGDRPEDLLITALSQSASWIRGHIGHK